jgi:hypothetical protein
MGDSFDERASGPEETRQLDHEATVPTVHRTLKFRMVVPGDQLHRFVIHDRDSIYAEGVDKTLWVAGSENASSVAAGECPLRTPDRDHPSRVSGLRDPAH